MDRHTAGQGGDGLVADEARLREDDLIDGLLWGIPSAIVGARLYYVLFYLSEFKDHEGHFSWSKAIAIWDGGLAIYGTVIVGILVALIYNRV